MFEGEITLADLEQELADYAQSQQKKKSRWTEDHDRLLVSGREAHGMTWEQMAAWWKAKFGWGSDKSLNARYKHIKAASDE